MVEGLPIRAIPQFSVGNLPTTVHSGTLPLFLGGKRKETNQLRARKREADTVEHREVQMAQQPSQARLSDEAARVTSVVW